MKAGRKRPELPCETCGAFFYPADKTRPNRFCSRVCFLRTVKWPAERADHLTILWNEGLSASRIGALLGVSTNAVIGKADRLKLAARRAPIRRAA